MFWRSDRKVLLLLTVGFTLVIGLLVAADRSTLNAMRSVERIAFAAMEAERASSSDAHAREAVERLEFVERVSFAEHFGYARAFLIVALVVAMSIAGTTILMARRLFRQVQWQGDELARLSAHMIETQEATVRRFSRELHDEFGQTLSAIEANLVALDAREQPHDLRGRIGDCIGLVQDVISQAREMSQLLRPSILDDFGLSASLEWLADGVGQRTGLHVRYTSTLSRRVGDEVETQLFRIAQEALTNTVRHAGATHVDITLEQQHDTLTLTIADNGRGFSSSVRMPRGLGLVSMRARARQVNGELIVRSEPHSGTTITVRVPLSEPAPIHVAPNPHPVG